MGFSFRKYSNNQAYWKKILNWSFLTILTKTHLHLWQLIVETQYVSKWRSLVLAVAEADGAPRAATEIKARLSDYCTRVTSQLSGLELVQRLQLKVGSWPRPLACPLLQRRHTNCPSASEVAKPHCVQMKGLFSVPMIQLLHLYCCTSIVSVRPAFVSSSQLMVPFFEA